MKNDELTQQFGKWLEKPENSRAFENLIRKVHQMMKARYLRFAGVPPEDVNLEDLKQECILILLEKRSRLAGLVERTPDKVTGLKSYLFNRLFDLTRGKNKNALLKDTRRQFYRHASTVLSGSDEFVNHKKNKTGLDFSRTQDPGESLLMVEDVYDIQYPADVTSNYSVLSGDKVYKANILQLARYFWTKAAEMAGKPDIAIPLSWFVKWVCKYVAIQADMSVDTDCKKDDDGQTPLEASAADVSFVHGEKMTLTTWAFNYFNRLNDREKLIFFYFECKKLPHKSVSELMGKKSNLFYAREKNWEKLRGFFIALDMVSPDYDDLRHLEEVDFFIFELCSNLTSWHARMEAR